MRFKIDTKMTYEQWKEQNKIDFLFISEIIKEEENDEKDDEK